MVVSAFVDAAPIWSRGAALTLIVVVDQLPAKYLNLLFPINRGA